MELILAQAPAIDGAYLLALLSRVLHILSAIILLGGIAYLRKVVVPAVPPGGDESGEQLYVGRRKAWAKWVGITTGLLLLTGFYNFYLNIQGGGELPAAYHPLFGVKFLLALVVFYLAALLAGKSAGAGRARSRAKRWLTICLVVGIAVVVLGSVLRSLHLSSPAAAAPPAVEDVEPEPEG